MLIFVLEYTHQLRKYRPVHLLLLSIIPVINIFMAWTNGWHGLVWTGFSPGSVENNVLIYHHGPWFWMNMAYIYLCLLFVFIVLIKEFFQTPQRFRFQVLIMLLAGLFPGVAGLIYVMGLSPIPNLDLSPIGATGTGIMFFWGVSRLQLLDLMPLAREVLVEQMQDGMIVLDRRDRIVDTNRAVFRMLGWQGKNYIGKDASRILPLTIVEALQNMGEFNTEIVVHSSDTTYVELGVVNLFLRPGEPAGKLLILRNITRRKMAELKLQQMNVNLQTQLVQITDLKDQLEQKVIRDGLTGLYNRRFFDEALIRLLVSTDQSSQKIGFLMLDIDHFKKINDSYGHPFGDQVLIHLGKLIQEKTRREDLACRYGGEEFIILLPGITEVALLERAQDLRKWVEIYSFKHMEKSVSLTISIGAALYPVHGDTAEEIIMAVDQALYRAKTGGRNCVVLFT